MNSNISITKQTHTQTNKPTEIYLKNQQIFNIYTLYICIYSYIYRYIFNAGKTQVLSFDRANNSGSINVKMDGSVHEEKYFKMLGLTFSSKLDWGPYIISIAKTVSKKIGALICSMKFLSPEVALYLYKSTICPRMEYCCHIWAGALVLYLLLLSNLLFIVEI